MKEAPPEVKNYLSDMVETTLPVNIDQLIALRQNERRTRRSIANQGEIEITEEDKILEELNQDRDAYILDFMQTWRNETVAPPVVEATRRERPDLVYPEIRRRIRKRKSEKRKRREQRRKMIDDKGRSHNHRGEDRKYRRRYHQKDGDEAYHQRELDELDFSSGSSEAASVRENTPSPWSRISDYSDSSYYDEGLESFLFFLTIFALFFPTSYMTHCTLSA